PLLLLADKRVEMRAAIRKSMGFILIYGALIVPAVLFRLSYAPGRAADAVAHGDRLELVKKIFLSIYYGVGASASSLQSRITDFLASGTSAEWTVATIVFGIVALLLYLLT